MNLDQLSPVYGFRKQPTMVDFPDRLAGLFFTSGCNFRCGFCHNLHSLGKKRPGMTYKRLQQACDDLRRQWVKAVVISGGEPTLWADLPALVAFFRGQGFSVKLDTNGSTPSMLSELLPVLSYVAMDVKCSLDHYPDVAAWQDRAVIAESIALLKSAGTPYEFRTTVLPDVHDETELEAMGELLAGARRLVLQPFLPQDDLPDPKLRTAPRTPPQVLQQAAAIMRPYVDEVVVRGG